jgi:hypothetical protein
VIVPLEALLARKIRKKLGELLVEARVVTQQQLDSVRF